jgi:hypothetical protein
MNAKLTDMHKAEDDNECTKKKMIWKSMCKRQLEWEESENEWEGGESENEGSARAKVKKMPKKLSVP